MQSTKPESSIPSSETWIRHYPIPYRFGWQDGKGTQVSYRWHKVKSYNEKEYIYITACGRHISSLLDITSSDLLDHRPRITRTHICATCYPKKKPKATKASKR